MTDEPSTTSRQVLLEEIVRAVTERFEATRQVVLLSLVGQTVSRGGYDLKKALGEQKLADFIRESLADRLEVVTHPADSKILAAHPKGIDLASEIDPFGSSRSHSPQRGTETAFKKDRVKRDVWSAFSHRLPPDHKRVLRLSPSIEYFDYPSDTEKPIGYEIESDLIVAPGGIDNAERNDAIYRNIRSWAAKNDINFSDLIEIASERRVHRSLLDAVLSSLSEADLSRVTMPLDVISRLRNRRI